MRNLLLTISFDGTAYCGFQVQANAVSVAQRVQDAIERVTGVRSDIKGCSRTDAGVHANMFCLSFRSDTPMSCDRLRRALDAVLPDDISANSVEEVPEDFHARYNCAAKRYIYKIWNSPSKSPFYRGLALHYPRRIDETLLNAAAAGFVGTHDFAGFCSSGSSVSDTVRTVYDCRVTREGELVTLSITGDGFLYNMVRIITGTLLAVNEGKISPDDIPGIIASRDRSRAGDTARPCGLYLDRVYYSLPGDFLRSEQ